MTQRDMQLPPEYADVNIEKIKVPDDHRDRYEQISSALNDKIDRLKGADKAQLAMYASGLEKRLLEASKVCLLYTSPSPRDRTRSRMPSSA